MPRKKIVIASIFLVLLITLALVFRPIPNASPENTLKTYGTIEEVFEAGENGVIFKLEGDARSYYIDHAIKNGLKFTALQTELPGQAVEIHWTPIDPLSRLKRITKVDVNSITLYSEIK